MNSYVLKNTLVDIQNVSLVLDGKTIIKPTTAIVQDIVRPNCTQGQIVGILGPSGVGKTQLSRILAGLQKPTTGCVNVVKQDGQLINVSAGMVGVVFQKYPLFRHRTVLGNLLIALERSGLTKKDKLEKITNHLTMFDMIDKMSCFPDQLSGGQRQRIAIIQELLCSEHFLVMDEPFTGLDPVMKDRVCELIIKVANIDDRNTIFVVAHDIAALVAIADTLWLLGRDKDDAGNVVQGATIKTRYDLISRGLAWNPEISSTLQFHEFVNEVKETFKTL